MRATAFLRLVSLAGALALQGAGALAAQNSPPSPEQVLGYPLGRHFTPTAGVQGYLRLLADSSPAVDYRVYGRTPERRELVQVVIARPEHLQRLEQILAANAELTRPETGEARAREIARGNPAVVYFSYGVHGNEASSSEAAMWTAWDLVRGAPEVAGVLDSLVVVVDPVANPDGRDRYVHWFGSVVGAQPNPHPAAREHHEPWPGGRYNHYVFDLNRDWAWATQPETRARLATWWQWNPQVHVDFHEMSYNSTYFFFPATPPINPIYPEHVLSWGRRFGEANAAAFDARGWPYYTAESFDLFYPGYGDSWPSLTGALGMTYEQAGHGMAGLAIVREAGDTLTLHQRAQHHRTAGHATLRTAAAGKTRLLLDFAAAARSVGAGLPDVLLVPGADTLRLRQMVEHLRTQGIEAERAGERFGASTEAYPGFARRTEFPAGTYRVRMRQPRGRLAATLLQPETELRGEYSYDITAWSLPYAYGVEAHRAASVPAAAGWRAAPVGAVAGAVLAAPGVGYLVPPGEVTSAALVRFLRAGGRAQVLARGSSFGGRRWPAGTWFLPSGGNDSLAARAQAAGLAAYAAPVRSGLSEGGIDLGSENSVPVKLPRIGVFSGEGISATSFGAHWFFLEQRLGLPFDALPLGRLASTELRDYDVLVVPDAAARVIGEAAAEALEAWVRAGGRLVAVGGGAHAVLGVADVKLREPKRDSAATAELLAGRREREREDWREQVLGVILQARLDPAHPLAWGAGRPLPADSLHQLFVLHEGTDVFAPAEGLEAVVHFPASPTRVSGVIAPESLRRLGEGVWLGSKRVGRGEVVLFAADPLFRLFWAGAHPLYLNALLLGTRL